MTKLLSIGLDDAVDSNIDTTVVVPTLLTAVNGTPGAGQFRSDITGRASIPDLSNMLSVQMGPQRFMTQEIYQLQSEFGSAGQQVFGVVNDKFNQVRYVGSWSVFNDTFGSRINTSTVGDYAEIVFYGTGLNVLYLGAGDTRNIVASVDGGADSAGLLVGATYSNVIDSRNYASNHIVNATSGLSLGFHTVKIKLSVNNISLYGFEVLTETSTIQVLPGTIAKGKRRNTLSALSSVAYDSSFESGTLGTRGGCVLVYLKNDGTIGKAVTPTDASSAFYPSAISHSNEELIRNYSPFEFGAGRSANDDWSCINQSSNHKAFTLDDGVTNLTAGTSTSSSAFINSLSGKPQGVSFGAPTVAATGNLTFTFVGTGLDVTLYDSAAGGSDQYTMTIDGGTSINLYSSGNTSVRTLQLCSGLPYGTHIVKIIKPTTASTFIPIFISFNVYAPKKPSLPVGAIELSQYYRVADLVATSSSGLETISTGMLRKFISQREAVYVGTWSQSTMSYLNIGGWETISTTTGDYLEYTFFGTGFEWRFESGTVTNTWTISVDGSSNLSAFATAFYGGGITSFTAATGAVVLSTSNVAGNGARVSGLSLGKHTIRITRTSGTGNCWTPCLDIITPIHAPVNNGPYVVQNTLTLGNNNFIDLRKFNKKDLVQSNLPKISQAVGVSTNFSSTVTVLTPCIDMSTVYYSEGEMVSIDSMLNALTTTAGQAWSITIFVNGINILNDVPYQYTAANSHQYIVTVNRKIFLPKGFHKVDAYWKTSGSTVTTGGSAGNFRQLTVTKMGNQ